jgi:two-component system alkaline phosphatase synthesis response regulator PhoP
MSEPCRNTGKHILLVDDQRDVRDTIKMLLGIDGHTVAEANNGREALEMFKHDRFDLVITDFLMPEMRGDEMAANLKHLVPSQPILMLTGSAEALNTSSPSINGFLRKPFSLVDLRQAIVQLAT